MPWCEHVVTKRINFRIKSILFLKQSESDSRKLQIALPLYTEGVFYKGYTQTTSRIHPRPLLMIPII